MRTWRGAWKWDNRAKALGPCEALTVSETAWPQIKPVFLLSLSLIYSLCEMEIITETQRVSLQVCVCMCPPVSSQHTPTITLLLGSLSPSPVRFHAPQDSVCACQVRLCVTPWTVACQIPLSMGFHRQKYWSGLPFPTPRDLPNPGIEPASLVSPTLAGRFFFFFNHWHHLGRNLCESCSPL